MPWEALPGHGRADRRDRPRRRAHPGAHGGRARRGQGRRAAPAVPLVATNHFMPENLVALRARSRGVLRRGSTRSRGGTSAGSSARPTWSPRPPRARSSCWSAHARLPDAVPGLLRHRRRPLPPHPRTPDDVPTVLFVGRLDQEKRVDELIRAFAALPAELPGRLEIVGDGARRADWTALAASLGIADRVRFRGFVSEEELLAAYARADVFCMPGIAELQSLATLEAMAAGTPVVAGRRDGAAAPGAARPQRLALHRPATSPSSPRASPPCSRDAALRAPDGRGQPRDRGRARHRAPPSTGSRASTEQVLGRGRRRRAAPPEAIVRYPGRLKGAQVISRRSTPMIGPRWTNARQR